MVKIEKIDWGGVWDKLLMAVLIVVALLQALAIVLKQIFPNVSLFATIKLGVVFYILLIAALIYVVFSFLFRRGVFLMIADTKFFFMMLIVLAILIWLLFSIKGLVPQAFSAINLQLQSMLMP